MHNQPLWTPSEQRIASSNLKQFISYAQSQHEDVPEDYESLHQWSVTHKEKFWQLVWNFYQVLGQNSGPILANPQAMPGAQWFPQASLNFAENLLKYSASPESHDVPAIIAYAENGQRAELSWPQLRNKTAALADFFRQKGIKKGDRIAAFLPNCAETVVAMLAATSLGAVWSSCSPDFGLQGVIDRFGQIKPRMLLATNGYHYNGKVVDTRDRVAAIVNSLDSLEYLIWHDYVDELSVELPATSPPRQTLLKSLFANKASLSFTPCQFNDPLYIMYSSGTTGVPKCIVHGIGGTLLQHLKELGLHTDLKPEDRIFYFTTCGWMMWNWLVSSLALGGTIVLYDGSPFAPSPGVLFDIAEKEGIRIFGAGAKYYSSCEKSQVHPGQSNDLTKLDIILSTGSPLSHESFDYLYREVKKDLCVSSISGGTDIISCFALGNPTLPVYRGELQCLGLGLEVAFCDSDGNDLVGEKGELICRSPFPSMPIGFWNDPEQAKFRAAYFDAYPDVWAHGDYGEIILHEPGKTGSVTLPEQRGIIIHGRSDAVLNPGGVRIGTAEIYRQVEKFDEILEAIAIGQRQGDDERIVLFVKLRPDLSLSDQLTADIKATIRKNTTPRHVPAVVVQVLDIPRTISGKIVELAVKNVVHGIPVKNKDALANPEALEYFSNREELEA